MNRMNVINPEAITKAMEMAHNGRFGFVDAKDFELIPEDTKPLDNYMQPENFPNCCVWHKQAYLQAKKAFENFPNCCERHKKLLTARWFKKENYERTPEKVVETLSYTQHHITVQISLLDWYEDITNYLEYSFLSFGQFPLGYGSPVGSELYYWNIQTWIQANENIDEEKKVKILEYITDYGNTQRATLPDMNILVDTYKRWLKIFPFSLPFFQVAKEKFAKSLPLLQDIPVYNKYTGKSKAKVITEKGLIEHLVRLTKEALGAIPTSELLKNGLINDVQNHRLALLNEAHRIAQDSLLDNFSKPEMDYIKILKRWLSNERNFFNELTKLNTQVKSEAEDGSISESKRDKLNNVLTSHGFYDLPLVKSLPVQNRVKLLDLLYNNKLPYQVALLSHLGFIDYLQQHHFSAKFKMYKELSKWFNSDKEGRAIKANISTLLKNTTEDKGRYTAHLHIKEVENDYQKLK